MIQSPVLQIFLFGQLQEHHVQYVYGTSIINEECIHRHPVYGMGA